MVALLKKRVNLDFSGKNRVKCSFLQASGFPLYWKCPVFQAAGGDKAETVSLVQLTKSWRRLVQVRMMMIVMLLNDT